MCLLLLTRYLHHPLYLPSQKDLRFLGPDHFPEQRHPEAIAVLFPTEDERQFQPGEGFA